jgi:hypothetical protein
MKLFPLLALLTLLGCSSQCNSMLTPCGQSPASTLGSFYVLGNHP